MYLIKHPSIDKTQIRKIDRIFKLKNVTAIVLCESDVI